MTLLLVKHFVLDFYYQPPYQWMNKGTYGHLGGILHATQHALGSFLILMFFNPIIALPLALIEFVLHYHIDWFKMSYNKKKGWGANTHEQFWQLLGLDQLAHQLCYIVMVALVFL